MTDETITPTEETPVADLLVFPKELLKTGMTLEYTNPSTGLCIAMVLLDTEDGDIISGGAWLQLDNLDMEQVIGVYQPSSTMNYLQGGLSKEGCTLLWKEDLAKKERKLELEELIKNAQDELSQL